MPGDQVVPEAEAFVVEYPGYVRDLQAVMQTMGGSSALAAAATGGNSVLQLRFRPDDPMSHPLYGERQATNGLLLKLTRQGADPDNSQVSAEVVARVHNKFTFTGMADYQYLPFDPSASAAASSKSTGPYGEEVEPLLCVPPLFTKSDVPLDYAFKQFRAADKPVNKNKPSTSWLIPYSVQQVPAMLSGTPGAAATSHQGSLIEAQLDARPIWTHASIAQQVPVDAQADLESEMPNQCYQFKEGPWREAWIKYGYDPRTNSSSWKYQTLHYDLPADWYSKISARSQVPNLSHPAGGPFHQPSGQNPAGQLQEPLGQGEIAAGHLQQPSPPPSIEDIHRFAALPTAQSTVFQLCDFSAPTVQSLLARVQLQDVCSSKTGWLSQADWQQIVNAVTEGFAKLL